MAKKGLKGTIDKQLKVYSAAAVGVLALAPSANAMIHYSGPKNLTVNPVSSYDIDLNGDATADFRFAYSSWYASGFSYGAGPYIRGLNGGAHIGAPPGYYCTDAIRLASNYQIKGTLANPNYIWRTNYWDSLNGTFSLIPGNCQGNFNNATGFIGVRFHTAACQESNFNYGWIQYRGDSETSGTIIDWAYEDTCNTPIAAGAKGSKVTATAVPTLDQWGMVIFTLLLGGFAARILGKQGKQES